jgi:UrcA family protein
MTKLFHAPLMAASALALALAIAPATPAGANEDEQYSEDGGYADPNDVSDQDMYDDEDTAYADEDEVVVQAPRARVRGEYGAPIREVSLSREVSFSDLDLRTRSGERTLRARVHAMARTLCRQLDIMHPVAAPDSPDCYTTAVNDAMYEVDDAIAQARGVASNE